MCTRRTNGGHDEPQADLGGEEGGRHGRLEAGANKSEIARRHAIRRQRVYQLLRSAMSDPKGKLREAEREAAFRRRVLELMR